MSDLEENMNKELTNIFNIEAKTNNQEVINQENVDAEESEKKKYLRRLNMRRLYENKSKTKKILAMLLYPDITYYLIKMKLE